MSVFSWVMRIPPFAIAGFWSLNQHTTLPAIRAHKVQLDTPAASKGAVPNASGREGGLCRCQEVVSVLTSVIFAYLHRGYWAGEQIKHSE